ncbi:hypothetical protein JOC94_004582, partial [Bacillus thermophilus]
KTVNIAHSKESPLLISYLYYTFFWFYLLDSLLMAYVSRSSRIIIDAFDSLTRYRLLAAN